MSIRVETSDGVAAYASALIGEYQSLHVKADISALTNKEIDSNGYLKPNVPLTLDGVLLADTVGTPQVETATVVGTIEAAGAGNATVIVTSANMANSPKTISVAVANDDTASQVAAKIRTALAADGDVNDEFTIGGTGANVILTDKSARANDATLNVSIDDGTSAGLTAAPTSANTTAGVAGGSNGVPCVTIEATKVADGNEAGDISGATDPFVACAVIGVLNRDVMEDVLARALTTAEIAALNGPNSKLALSLT
jgi:hypothetical protein